MKLYKENDWDDVRKARFKRMIVEIYKVFDEHIPKTGNGMQDTALFMAEVSHIGRALIVMTLSNLKKSDLKTKMVEEMCEELRELGEREDPE